MTYIVPAVFVLSPHSCSQACMSTPAAGARFCVSSESCGDWQCTRTHRTPAHVQSSSTLQGEPRIRTVKMRGAGAGSSAHPQPPRSRPPRT